MKKKEIKTLKTKSNDDLLKTLEKKRLELLKTTLKIKAGEEKNVKKAKNLRIDISQILTILKENELTKGKETDK